MAILGNLRALLSAESGRFSSDMQKARKALRSNTSRMNRSLARLSAGFASVRRRVGGAVGSLFSLRGIAAQLLGAGGLGLLIKRSVDLGDSIAKTADRIGISTDQLQKWRFAAGQAGVEQSKFDQGMQAFVKRLGEAKQGTGSLLTFLNKMDPAFKARVLNAENVEEAFGLVIDKMASMEDFTKRAALSSAAFSRGSGSEMVNIAKDGAESFQEWAEIAEDMGIVIDEKLLRQSETAKDQLSLLAEVVKANLTKAVLEAAPEIARLAGEFAKAVPEVIKFAKSVTRWIGGAIETVSNFVQTIVDGIGQAIFWIAKQRDAARELIHGRSVRTVSPIQTDSPPSVAGFRHGGGFRVSGAGGPDSQLVQFRATPGEVVTVTPDGGPMGATFHIDARGAELGVERRLVARLEEMLDRRFADFARTAFAG